MGRMARPSATVRTALAYAAMVAGAVVLFLVIRAWGEALPAPPAPPPAGGPAQVAGRGELLLHLLLALAAVVVLGQVLARLLALAGQPPVIGEVLAGILLGPS